MSGQDIMQEPRQAVFRVTENGESMYFSVPESVELLQAAAHLRNYLSDKNAGTKLQPYFHTVRRSRRSSSMRQPQSAWRTQGVSPVRMSWTSTRRRFLRSISWTAGRSTRCRT